MAEQQIKEESFLKECEGFLKECVDHVYFCRNMDSHAYTNILISKLVSMATKSQNDYDKLLIKWVKDHNWDSLEKDKALILRHLRTFVGDIG